MSPSKTKKRPSPLVTSTDFGFSSSGWANFRMLKASLAQITLSPASATTPTAWGDFLTIETPTRAIITPIAQFFNFSSASDNARTPTAAARFFLENMRAIDSDGPNRQYSANRPINTTNTGASQGTIIDLDDSIVSSIAHAHHKLSCETGNGDCQSTGSHSSELPQTVNPSTTFSSLISTPSPWRTKFNTNPMVNDSIDGQVLASSTTNQPHGNGNEKALLRAMNNNWYASHETKIQSSANNSEAVLPIQSAIGLDMYYDSGSMVMVDWRKFGSDNNLNIINYPADNTVQLTPYSAMFMSVQETAGISNQISLRAVEDDDPVAIKTEPDGSHKIGPYSHQLEPSFQAATESDLSDHEEHSKSIDDATYEPSSSPRSRTKKSRAKAKSREGAAASIKHECSDTLYVSNAFSNVDDDTQLPVWNNGRDKKILNRVEPGSLVWEKLEKAKKGTYSCTHCTDKFNTILSFAQHLDRYEIARPYLCAYGDCPWAYVGFQKQSEWKRHVNYQHGNRDPYECPHGDCGKAFSRKDSMKRHMILVHENYMSRRNKKLREQAIKRRRKLNIEKWA